MPCKFCGGTHPDDVGGDYDRLKCESDWCLKEIERLKSIGAPQEDLERIERQLEMTNGVDC